MFPAQPSRWRCCHGDTVVLPALCTWWQLRGMGPQEFHFDTSALLAIFEPRFSHASEFRGFFESVRETG